mgnify:CR=1 FL=1
MLYVLISVVYAINNEKKYVIWKKNKNKNTNMEKDKENDADNDIDKGNDKDKSDDNDLFDVKSMFLQIKNN